MKKPRYRRIPLGLGDVVVMVTLAILVVLAVWPYLESGVVAGHESATEQRLARLLTEADNAHVLDRFESLMRATQSIESLRPIRDLRGPDVGMYPALWRTKSHLYVLDLLELVHGGHAVLRACPRARTETLVEAGWDDQPDGTLGELLVAVKSSGLREAMQTLVDTMTGELQLRAPAERQPATELPALLADSYYLYRIDFVKPQPSTEWRMEALAWPIDYGEGGFAAFYADAPHQIFHTRNIMNRYSGPTRSRRGRPPALGAAFSRSPEADRGGTQGFTGIDGNRWFMARR